MPSPELPQTVEECHAVIRQLLQRIEELERRLNQNSRNSSRPPSSDLPGTPRPTSKPPTGRKPGGQPGHEGHERALLPAGKVHRIEELWPDECENCHRGLRRLPLRTEVGAPRRHQVTEVPAAPAEVVEYRQHTQMCPGCEHATTAALPPGVPEGAFGPRLQGIAAVLSGMMGLSKRAVQTVARELFGAEISLGAVVACEQRTSAVLAPAVAEAHAYVQTQPLVNADETGWRERRKRAWLWVAVSEQVTVFLVQAKRGAEAAKKLLGRFSGILSSDRWCAYAQHLLRKRQLCWAHLKRHFEGFREDAKAKGIGETLVGNTVELFRIWHQARDGVIARSTFQQKVSPLREAVERLLELGTKCGSPKVEATCRELLAMKTAMWTFVRVEGVEPTNNAAERAIRPAVLMRKNSFGTHSEDGSRFIERMLTVATTLKQQRRSVVEYVTEACERALYNRTPRSLLPAGLIMTPQALRAAQQTP